MLMKRSKPKGISETHKYLMLLGRISREGHIENTGKMKVNCYSGLKNDHFHWSN